MLERFIERLARALMIALGLAFVGAVLLNFANVVGRYVFATAILGADEVQVFVMVWMTFAGAVVVTWRNRHLRMDVLVDMLPPRVRQPIRMAEGVLLVAVAAFMLVQSVRFVWLMVAMDRRSEAASIPMVVPHAALVLGFALIAVLGSIQLVSMLRATYGRTE